VVKGSGESSEDSSGLLDSSGSSDSSPSTHKPGVAVSAFAGRRATAKALAKKIDEELAGIGEGKSQDLDSRMHAARAVVSKFYESHPDQKNSVFINVCKHGTNSICVHFVDAEYLLEKNIATGDIIKWRKERIRDMRGQGWGGIDRNCRPLNPATRVRMLELMVTSKHGKDRIDEEEKFDTLTILASLQVDSAYSGYRDRIDELIRRVEAQKKHSEMRKSVGNRSADVELKAAIESLEKTVDETLALGVDDKDARLDVRTRAAREKVSAFYRNYEDRKINVLGGKFGPLGLSLRFLGTESWKGSSIAKGHSAKKRSLRDLCAAAWSGVEKHTHKTVSPAERVKTLELLITSVHIKNSLRCGRSVYDGLAILKALKIDPTYTLYGARIGELIERIARKGVSKKHPAGGERKVVATEDSDGERQEETDDDDEETETDTGTETDEDSENIRGSEDSKDTKEIAAMGSSNGSPKLKGPGVSEPRKGVGLLLAVAHLIDASNVDIAPVGAGEKRATGVKRGKVSAKKSEKALPAGAGLLHAVAADLAHTKPKPKRRARGTVKSAIAELGRNVDNALAVRAGRENQNLDSRTKSARKLLSEFYGKHSDKRGDVLQKKYGAISLKVQFLRAEYWLGKDIQEEKKSSEDRRRILEKMCGNIWEQLCQTTPKDGSLTQHGQVAERVQMLELMLTSTHGNGRGYAKEKYDVIRILSGLTKDAAYREYSVGIAELIRRSKIPMSSPSAPSPSSPSSPSSPPSASSRSSLPSVKVEPPSRSRAEIRKQKAAIALANRKVQDALNGNGDAKVLDLDSRARAAQESVAEFYLANPDTKDNVLNKKSGVSYLATRLLGAEYWYEKGLAKSEFGRRRLEGIGAICKAVWRGTSQEDGKSIDAAERLATLELIATSRHRKLGIYKGGYDAIAVLKGLLADDNYLAYRPRIEELIKRLKKEAKP
jgi:hypothetical protein